MADAAYSAAVTAYWVACLLLGYTYLAYPALMAFIGRRRPAVSAGDARSPTVSLLVPAYNEENVLAEKLENALLLDYPRDRLEIIVASDGSSDRTVEITRRFSERGVRLMAFDARRGKASVMNDAVRAASAELLLLCDANVMFRPNALRRLVGWFASPQVGAVTGDVRLASQDADFGAGESRYYRMERAIQCGESRVGSVMGVDGGMYLVRKQLVPELPPDTILDDFVVSMRVIRQGYRVVYDSNAVANECATAGAAQEFRRRVRVMAGAVQTWKRCDWPRWSQPVEVWQYVSHKLLRWLGPVWLALLLAANVCLWTAYGWYGLTLAAQVAIYAIALVATASRTFRRTRVGGVPFYFCMSQVAMVVGLARGLFNRQKVTWTKADRSRSGVRPASDVLAG
jgi:poly-beta-1,6-N-acetyl-D-glucosamine synthase